MQQNAEILLAKNRLLLYKYVFGRGGSLGIQTNLGTDQLIETICWRPLNTNIIAEIKYT